MIEIPKVTVVIPCYNDEKYIEEAVNSALNQTFKNFEIIIVDDGSNKETKVILSKIKDKKVKLIKQKNKGLSAARNVGIKLAKGKFILTLDSDDIFDVTFLEKAVPVLEKEEYIGVVTCFYNCFNDKGEVLSTYTPSGGKVDDFLFKNNSIGNALFRKQCWIDANGYDENMKKGFEDWEFWLSVTKNKWSVFVIKDYLFNYRIKENSMFIDTIQNHKEKNLEYIFLKHQDLYKNRFAETISCLADLAYRNKENERKRINSLDYRLGKTILRPLRSIKKIFTS